MGNRYTKWGNYIQRQVLSVSHGRMINMRDLDYLRLLAKEFPTVQAASSEIINLKAICGLPKGTEYFFSDLHGEHEAFVHLLRSASGIIREKISETFGYLIAEEEEMALANLIYYPENVLRNIQKEGKFTQDWQRITIYRLVRMCKQVSSKYTRSKVRKKMPPAFAYVIDELLHVDYSDQNKKIYYDAMGFSREEYWSKLPFPSPGELPNPGIELKSPALQADS